MRRSGFWEQSIKETAAILVISAVTALTVNWLRPQSLPLFNPSTQPPQQATPPTGSGPEAGTISIDSALDYFQQGTALFVDARMPVDYAAGHIEGAVNLPDYRFDEVIGPFLEATPADRPIITYCDGIDCPLSKDLAEKLVLVGFETVYHLPDGWAKWRAHRMPVEKGE